MNRFLLLIALPMIFLTQACSHQLQQPGGSDGHPMAVYQPPKADEWQLGNGLTVLFLQDSELPIVSATLYTRGGALWGQIGKPGLVETMGALMRQGGAGTNSADQLDKFLEQKSATISSSVGDEFGVISFECLRSDLEEVFDVFAQVVRTPRYEQERISLWRGIALESIKRRKDEPTTVANIAFTEMLFGATPYGEIIGELDVKAIQRRDLLATHQEFIRPDGAILVVSGDLTRREAESLIVRYFEDWQARGSQFPPPPLIETVVSPAIYFVPLPFEQSTVFMGQRGVPRLTPDYLAIEGFNKIFGSAGFSSRLMKRVRSDLGLVYSVSGEISPGVIQGKNAVMLQTKAASTAKAITESLGILESMQRGPIMESEMKAMKDMSINSFVFKFDTVAKLAQRYALLQILSYPDDYDLRYIPGIKALSPGDIQLVAEKRWNIAEFVYIVVGNETAYQSIVDEQQNPASPLANVRLIRANFSDRIVLPNLVGEDNK